MATIPEQRLLFSCDGGERITVLHHRGAPKVFDIFVMGGQKKLEIEVDVRPNAEMRITLQDSSVVVRRRRAYSSRILWVNMAHIEGHDWNEWLDQKLAGGGYVGFVLCATGQAISSGDIRRRFRMMELDPVLSVTGLNNDQGCLVFGAVSRFLSLELDPAGSVRGPDVSMATKFSFLVQDV